jgi:hypothetical protein
MDAYLFFAFLGLVAVLGAIFGFVCGRISRESEIESEANAWSEAFGQVDLDWETAILAAVAQMRSRNGVEHACCSFEPESVDVPES